MPLKPVDRQVSEVEQKLALLYCLRALGDVEIENLWRVAAELELMDYVAMRLSLHALEIDRMAASYRGRFSERYVLTPLGEENLRLFAARLPFSVRRHVDAAAPDYRARFQRERELSVAYGHSAFGRPSLRLCLREGELPLMTLLYEPLNPVALGAVREAFLQNARAAYRALLDVAARDLTPDPPAPPPPTRAGLPPDAFELLSEIPVGADSLVPLTPREWLIACRGALPDALGGGRLTARMLWPDRAMAERMYQAWEAAPDIAARDVAAAAMGGGMPEGAGETNGGSHP